MEQNLMPLRSHVAPISMDTAIIFAIDESLFKTADKSARKTSAIVTFSLYMLTVISSIVILVCVKCELI